MSRIDDLLNLRRGHRLFDEELWSFAERVQGSNLVNLTEAELRWRLEQIERNIQYLDSGETPRDDLPPERGWLSPWWWWRIRHWTLAEFARRQLSIAPSSDIEIPTPLAPEFLGVVGGGQRLLVRISRRDRVLEMLLRGRVRFAPASLYNDAALDAARADEEMAKAYRRPGSALTITGPSGRRIEPIGDVTFTSRRAIELAEELVDAPYWFCSFSSDLDPRLFVEFADRDGGEDACIVIFDPKEFVRRLQPGLNAAAPRATKQLFPNEYFDPHHPPADRLSPIRHKHFAYAYQTEMRFVVDPDGNPWVASAPGEPFFVEGGSLEDIAGVYAPDGQRIVGSGPPNFLA